MTTPAQSADTVRRHEERGQRDAYLVSFFVVVVSWLVIEALGWDYNAFTAGNGLLAAAYLSHRRWQHSAGEGTTS